MSSINKGAHCRWGGFCFDWITDRYSSENPGVAPAQWLELRPAFKKYLSIACSRNLTNLFKALMSSSHALLHLNLNIKSKLSGHFRIRCAHISDICRRCLLNLILCYFHLIILDNYHILQGISLSISMEFVGSNVPSVPICRDIIMSCYISFGEMWIGYLQIEWLLYNTSFTTLIKAWTSAQRRSALQLTMRSLFAMYLQAMSSWTVCFATWFNQPIKPLWWLHKRQFQR